MDQVGMDDVLAVLIALGAAVIPLAAGVTKAVDFLRNLFDKDDKADRWIWNVAAFVVSGAFCVGWGFNVLDALAAAVPALANTGAFDGLMGEIGTAVLVGGAAGFWHGKLEAMKLGAAGPVAVGQADEVSVGTNS